MKSKTDTINVLTKMIMYACSTLLLVFIANFNVQAQRTVTVNQGVGTLNDAIVGDTTATGARVDSNTVYVLSSGGTYLLDGSIEHRGYHLTIVAEDGYTERPKLIPAVDDGGVSDRPFRPRGDLTLRGLYITNEDELGGLNTRIVRISENEVTITIDDSHLDKDGGGTIKYAYVNQNTAVNIGKNTAFEFGPTVKGIFTNNMVYNASFYGNNTNGDETITVIGLDSLTTEELAEFGAQSFTLNNNNF